MTPSLYDLLDVEPDASTDEIRAAWKAAIAELDPTDRRFRAYNDAAGILLDPDQRASYDAELAEAAAEERAEPEAAEQPAGEQGAAEAPAAEQVTPYDDATAPLAGHGESSRFAAAPHRAVVLAVALIAMVAAGLAVWAATWDSTFEERPKDLASLRSDQAASLVAAESIAGQLFSYDYRQMGESTLAEKQELMTPAYAEEWAGVQRALREEAEQQEAVVNATVRASALRSISPDGRQAQVIVFADQLVEKAGSTEANLRQMATLRLTRDGDRWLLEKICTDRPEC